MHLCTPTGFWQLRDFTILWWYIGIRYSSHWSLAVAGPYVPCVNKSVTQAQYSNQCYFSYVLVMILVNNYLVSFGEYCVRNPTRTVTHERCSVNTDFTRSGVITFLQTHPTRCSTVRPLLEEVESRNFGQTLWILAFASCLNGDIHLVSEVK